MDKFLDQLEAEMATLLKEHEGLLSLIGRKREAMRLAKPRIVSEVCELENQHVQKIGEAEKRRQQIVGVITGLVNPGATRPLTLEEIAQKISEPRRGRLLVHKQQLRQIIETVKKENEMAGRITEGLLRHVQGMVQQVAFAIGAAGTYGRRGVTSAPAGAVSSFVVSG